MTEKYVVLRVTSAARPSRPVRRSVYGDFDFEFRDESRGSVPETLAVETVQMERSAVRALAADPSVAAAAMVIPMQLVAPTEIQEMALPCPNGTSWGVSAVRADKSDFTGDGVVVAVLDTGIDRSHPAFAGMEIEEKDFTGEGNGDRHGHGTHCAGTIFGRAVGGTRIGVAPGVRKALIGKVLATDGGSSEQIVSAINWAAEEGAHVISLSLGIDFPALVEWLHTTKGLPLPAATSRALEAYRANVLLFDRLASFIQARGHFLRTTVLVAAAGNESRRDAEPAYEIAVSPPAAAPGIISVAALGETAAGFTVAPFSNTGATVSAPGVLITSASPGGGLAAMSGTSMAAPHVAGVAALWAQKIQAESTLSHGQLTARLIGSANTAGLQPGLDPSHIGAGLVRAPQ